MTPENTRKIREIAQDISSNDGTLTTREKALMEILVRTFNGMSCSESLKEAAGFGQRSSEGFGSI
jgi:hypothetical protein